MEDLTVSTTDQPLVSVIVCAYQAERTVGAAISSALTQTYPAVQVVVVDDGSTDATGAIARAHQSAGDVVVIEQANMGAAGARNAAMASAKGDFFAFLDADDVLLPNYVEAALATHRAAGPGKWVVVNNAFLMTGVGVPLRRRYLTHPIPPPSGQRLALLHANFAPISSLFPRALYDDIGGMAEELDRCEDWEFWLRAAFAGWHFVRQPQRTMLYRWVGESLSSDSVAMFAAEDRALQRIYDAHQDQLTAAEREYLNVRLTQGSPRDFAQRGEQALRDGNLSDAAAAFTQASALSPGDRRLRLRAALVKARPTAHLMAYRQRRIDTEIGREHHVTNSVQ